MPVKETPPNGTPVTWRELILWGKPLNDKIDSLAKSIESLTFLVEQLHVSHAADKAIERYKLRVFDRIWVRMGTMAALAGAVSYIVAIKT